MNDYKNIYFSCVLVLLTILAQAQEDTLAGSPTLQYDNHIYKPEIATAYIEVKGLEMSNPIMKLDDGESQLTLHFDVLSHDVKDYSYTFIHCNADWTPSNINKYEYLDGFDDAVLFNYEFSSGTFQPYTHYTLDFPNADLNLTKSGNYLLVVFEDGEQENLVLTRRFCLVDQKAGIDLELKRSSMSKYFDTHHELKVNVSYKGLNISNPFGEVKITVMQNFRWDNAYYDLQPAFVREEKLIYNQEGKIVFPATNEFRFTDVRNLRLLNRTVKSLSAKGDTAYLFPEDIRSFSNYDFYKEANGKFVTGRYEARDNQLEADYVHVTFRLVSPSPFLHGDVYIFGGLSEWKADEAHKMEYNFKKRGYEKTLYLKQGYYNYMYAFKESAGQKLSVDFLEGNHFETENNYQVLVYYRPAGERYDQLISFKEINSIN